jgi:esterase
VLNHSVIEPKSAHEGTVFILHGILGSGLNWWGFARRLARARPGLRLVLADLRCHGRSPPMEPPHTVDACAHDLLDLASEVGMPDAVVGHSFGGKVALAYLRYARPREIWSLDSPPGPLADRPGDRSEVANVISSLRAVPQPLERRKDLEDLLEGAGYSPAVASWMTTNLRRAGDGYVWRFDLPGVESLIRDYFGEDLWPVLQSPPPGTKIHVLRAENGGRWTEKSISRLQWQCRARLHLLPASGHWVHVDNPEGLVSILGRWLLPPGAAA